VRVAIVGGGINGVMTAWACARRGHTVELFERETLMSGTSRASTKLLHGGIRYLENGEIHLVYESLHERTWWTTRAPQLAHPLRLFLPVYRGVGRPRWMLGAGLTLYDILAFRHGFGRHRWYGRDDVVTHFPTLRPEGLIGAYAFYDAQMDDHALGLWAADQARHAGVTIHEHAQVTRVGPDGTVQIGDATHRYDRVINVGGPWAKALLDASGIAADHELDLVRGSHLFLDGSLTDGLLVQVSGERRICFVLPYQGRILVGTTEVRQTLQEPIVCTPEEKTYLLGVYNQYFTDTRTVDDVRGTFAGVRPLLRSAIDPSRATREAAIERRGDLITVFGGKWTTSRILGEHAAAMLERNG